MERITPMRVLSAIVLAWAVTVLLVLLTHAVFAHGWYDPACCSDRDCHPIADCSEIQDAPGGYTWRDPNTKVNFFFRREALKGSHDNQCHVCTINFNGLCLYMPMTT